VVAPFDDYRPLAAIPVPAAMKAAVVITFTEFGASAAKLITTAELATLMKTVATDANTDPEFLRVTAGRCRNGNNRDRCKRKTKISHLQSSRS
jgi:hypothetical protein